MDYNYNSKADLNARVCVFAFAMRTKILNFLFCQMLFKFNQELQVSQTDNKLLTNI